MNQILKAQILFAEHQSIYALKLLGEVRVNCCETLDAFIDDKLIAQNAAGVIIDLTDTEIIDSTALGMLAKIAVHFKNQGKTKPLIISTREDIDYILDSMGFDSVFNIIHENPTSDQIYSRLPEKTSDEQSACKKVIEAHRTLMALNEQNHNTFKSLVETLEAQANGVQNVSNNVSSAQSPTNHSEDNLPPLH